MKKVLKFIDTKSATTIFNALGKDENSTRFVGGVVRDAMLGLKTTDIDIATVLSPDEVMMRLRKAGIKAIPTGIKYGTVTALVGGSKFEITTLRKDVATDGRHAKVEYAVSWKEDAARRDFTINGMSVSLEGKLFDYFGGEKDLAKGKVKFIGNAEERIKEDYLRILRYFRFYERFGKGAPDAAAMKAATKLKSGIKHLSGERIQQEMLKLFAGENTCPAIAAMDKCGVLKVILPKSNASRLKSYLEFEKKYFASNTSPLARIVATTTDKKFMEKWKLSGKQKQYIEHLRACTKEAKLDEASIKKLIRKFGNEIVAQSLIISLSSFPRPRSAEANIGRCLLPSWLREGERRESSFLDSRLRGNDQLFKLARTWKSPEFPVSGDDLIKVGMKPGKELGATLKKLERKWENSGYTLAKNELMKLLT